MIFQAFHGNVCFGTTDGSKNDILDELKTIDPIDLVAGFALVWIWLKAVVASSATSNEMASTMCLTVFCPCIDESPLEPDRRSPFSNRREAEFALSQNMVAIRTIINGRKTDSFQYWKRPSRKAWKGFLAVDHYLADDSFSAREDDLSSRSTRIALGCSSCHLFASALLSSLLGTLSLLTVVYLSVKLGGLL